MKWSASTSILFFIVSDSFLINALVTINDSRGLADNFLAELKATFISSLSSHI